MAIPYESGEPLTCRQIRELDVLAIEHVGVPGIVLMENAGRAVAEFVFATLLSPSRSRVAILCGPGNNGGDGFVVARHLSNAEVVVHVVLAAQHGKYRGDAATNLHIVERMDVPLIDAAAAPVGQAAREALESADVIVDALLGTGTAGPPRPPIADLVRIANAAARARRIAIDIPTGLDGDRGTPADPCFVADATVTLVAEKIGFSQPAARAVLGRVVVADIGAPRRLIPGRNDPRSAP